MKKECDANVSHLEYCCYSKLTDLSLACGLNINPLPSGHV
jgi:hypothetical protein